jgi:small-conductance mechanosensitive channel
LTLALFALCFVGLGHQHVSLYRARRVTIWDAAAPASSQGFMLIGAGIMLPLILGYTGWAYWVFRGKVGTRGLSLMQAMLAGPLWKRLAWMAAIWVFSDLLAGAIYLTAALIVLNLVLDLPIRGLLATSGVIAIVLGLALQNTLADVFSGIAVGLEKPFHVGDRVTIEEHAEGIVVEMNWRSIRIQTDGEDVATIPNSIVARSQIINRSVPTERRAASVEIPTLSSARSEHLMDLISQAILLCPGILEHPVPSISIKHVGTRTTTLGVTYFVATTPAMSAAKSQLLRQVRRLFRHAGVQDGEPVSTEGVLKSLILFESLSAAQLESLASAMIERRLETGGHVFEQGTLGASLYIMRAGVFEVVRQREDGQPIVYGRIGPGEYLGEISMMTGEPRPVTVTALTAGIVYELPRTAIEALLGKDKALSAALEQSVQRGLALLDRDDAARACQPLDAGGSLLGRIRNFLHLQPAS